MDFSGYDLILTPNHRLSASLNTPLPVYSLSQWLEKVFQEGDSRQTWIDSHRQRFLMTTLITQHFPDYVGLAPLVQSAWRLCHHYKIDIHSTVFEKNDDTLLFQAIAKCIQKYYRQSNLIDSEQIMAKISLPAKTALFGFNTLTPLESQLFATGTLIHSTSLPQNVSQHHFSDPEQELKTMAQWAASRPKHKQIACIIPDLDTRHDKIEYLFDALGVDQKNYTISAVKQFSAYYFIQDILSLLSNLSNTATLKPSEWAAVFENEINRHGFPRTLPLTNEEFQLSEKLLDVFKHYKSYDFMNTAFNFDQAIVELNTLCDRISFRVTASKTANIHVLSVLESQGLHVDEAWITGMDSRHWPQQSKQNPFLPFPHTEKTQPNFDTLANNIIYSYPLQIDDTTAIPAKILGNIPVENIHLDWPTPTVGAQSFTPVNDKIPVELQQLKHHGTQIFKDHIACPFRAFAKHRLHALKIEEPKLGLNAIQKGNAVHEILEHLWKAIPSKQKLLSTEPEKLIILIDEIIDNSLKKFNKILQPIFIRAEKLRLEKLMLDWLDLEKSREDFMVVSTEQTLETHLGQLPLKLRIDRIDQIALNKYLIIDYKTSQYDIRGDYLDEPQLPLYAVVSAQSIDKIAYAYVRTGNSKLKEIPVGDLKQQWETELLKIAEDFLSGNAEVKPKYGEETCRMCDLKSLCRINPSPTEPLL